VHEAARSVDLLDRLDQRIGALSGGQKKCASLASEILNRPSLLFLDEVTSGLDESTDWEIMRLLRRLADV
jgi:ABC transport system ATP-binding/permease protein